MLALPPEVTSPRHWLLGPAAYVRRDPLYWIPRWFSEYGDCCRLTSRLGQATLVGCPQLARQVLVDHYSHYEEKSRAYGVLRILFGNGLVTSAGEFWRGQRKLVQPAFHRRRLEDLFAMMVQRVTHCAGQLSAAAAAGQTVDLAPLFSQLTLDVIARAMFSSDVQGAAAEVSRHIAVLNEYALLMLRQPWRFLLPRRFPTPFSATQHRSLKALNQIVHGIIQARRRRPSEHDDLLGMLLSATEEETGRGMTDEQLRDEVMTIFVAGHETTANAMAWLVSLIAQHPEVEERLLAEIDAHWPEAGLNAASLGQFTYTKQAIEESMRVYPTIWSVGRSCTREDELGGYRIPIKMNVVVPIFHFHWDERFWPEPRRFDPDRFAPERRPPNEPMIYFPFGAGPRSCVGNHFAMQELMIMTLILYRHLRFCLPAGTVVEPDPLITLRPKNGMPVHVVQRRVAEKATARATTISPGSPPGG